MSRNLNSYDAFALWVVEEHNYKTAVAELGVSVHTVSFHLRSIYDK
jgi:DNA-binding CsgD family transcriptional regulator